VCGTSANSALGWSPLHSPLGHEASTDRWRPRHRNGDPCDHRCQLCGGRSRQILSYRRHRTRAVFLAWPRSVRVANCWSRPGWHTPAQGPGRAWPRPKCPGSARHPLTGVMSGASTWQAAPDTRACAGATLCRAGRRPKVARTRDVHLHLTCAAGETPVAQAADGGGASSGPPHMEAATASTLSVSDRVCQGSSAARCHACRGLGRPA